MHWCLKGFMWLLFIPVGFLACLGAYLVFLQPPLYFPRPSGPTSIGTTTKHIHFGEKQMMIQLYYPTNERQPQYPTTPYAPDLIQHMKSTQLPAWLLMAAYPIFTYSIPEAKLSPNLPKLPILLFSHGYASSRSLHVSHCEELASHGYFIVSISHSTGTSFVSFPDGRTEAIDQATIMESMKTDPMSAFKGFSTTIDVWVDDIKSILDYLPELAQKFPLDLNKIGMIGHSLGGATAAQVCRQDDRVKAGINMDGALFGPNPASPFQKPFLFLLAEEVPLSEMEKQMESMGVTNHDFTKSMFEIHIPMINKLFKALDDGYKVTIKKSGHSAFSDIALLKERCLFSGFLSHLGVGEINGVRVTKIITEVARDFFDVHLKGEKSKIVDLNGDSNFPEIELLRSKTCQVIDNGKIKIE